MLELSGIIILGILAQWVAWKFKIPAILPLILIGLLVGPIAAEYLSEDGTKWIKQGEISPCFITADNEPRFSLKAIARYLTKCGHTV